MSPRMRDQIMVLSLGMIFLHFAYLTSDRLKIPSWGIAIFLDESTLQKALTRLKAVTDAM